MIVVEYWKFLPKSKQPGGGRPDQNTSSEHLSAQTKEVLSNKRSFVSLEVEVIRRNQ